MDAKSPALPGRRRFRVILAALFTVAAFPRCLLGFGADIDAWLVAEGADRMLAEGHYVRSRSTGFPLYEIGIIPFVHLGGFVLSNLVSLLAALALLGAFFALEDRGELRNPRIVQAILVFVPIVFVNAATTMDYLPALALLVWGYVQHRSGRDHLSAVLIGLACGVRPTSALFLLPIAFSIARRTRGVREAAVFLMIGGLVGFVVFAPALTVLPFDLVPRSPSLQTLRGVLEVFGLVPTVLVLCIVCASLVERSRRGRVAPNPLPIERAGFHVSMVALFLGPFLFNSDETAYLLPAVPSALLLLDQVLATRAMALACALLMSNHFVELKLTRRPGSALNLEATLAHGTTRADVDRRLFQRDLRDALFSYRPTVPTLLLDESDITAAVVHNPGWVVVDGRTRQKEGLLYVALLPRVASELDAGCGRELHCVRRCNVPSKTTPPEYLARFDCIEDSAPQLRAMGTPPPR